jgi:hypothetical protein
MPRISWFKVGGFLVGIVLATMAPPLWNAAAPNATAAPTTAPTTAPAAQAALETRALEDFSGGQYASALPELQKVAESLKDQPDRLGLIQEDIRVCQKQIAQGNGTPALASNSPTTPPSNAQVASASSASPPVASTANPPLASSAVPQDGPPTAEQRKPHDPPQPGEIREMAIKELGNFQYDPDKGGNIPPDVLALSGMKVRLHGFMIPMDQASAITEFALVPSLFACCFGQPPQIQHTIVVHVPKGKAVSYYADEIVVEGTLVVQEKKEDGFIVSIFEVNCTSVKAAAK